MNNHQLKIKDGKINFRCKLDKCNRSCCGPFMGISSELHSADNRPFEEIVLTEEDCRNLIDSGYENLIEEGFSPLANKEYYKIALKEDGTCKAWVNGRCSIHAISPTLCKAFPFYFDMFSGLCAIGCEGFSEDCQVELADVAGFIESAKKMYRFWLDFYSE